MCINPVVIKNMLYNKLLLYFIIIFAILFFIYQASTITVIYAADPPKCDAFFSCDAGDLCKVFGGTCTASCETYQQCNLDGVCIECSGLNCKCGGGTACFPAGTKVTLSDKSTRNIEDIRVGDKVIGQDESGKSVVSTVQQLEKPVSDNMCEIKFAEGDRLEVTKGHPLATIGGWKAIDPKTALSESPGVSVTSLNVGDQIIKSEKSATVSSIACWSQKVQTYNLAVDNAHTYFAGGFLVHNKGSGNIHTACLECGAGDFRQLGQVQNLHVTQDSSIRASWSFSGHTFTECNQSGHIEVFIGTNQYLVNHNCFVNSDRAGDLNGTRVVSLPPTYPGKDGGGLGGTSTRRATAGVANTGGGGGGASNIDGLFDCNNNYGHGGKGVVIMSYPKGTMSATGGLESDDAKGNHVHKFNATGTFTVTSGGTLQVLLVAGGGGGGPRAGGGGGGGGTILTSKTLGPGSYNVKVGGGGTTNPIQWQWGSCDANCESQCLGYHYCGVGNGRGGNGGTSSFAGTTVQGGGGGGSTCNSSSPANFGNDYVLALRTGARGGSGGGASSDNSGLTAGGAGIAGQGYHGGSSTEGTSLATSRGGGGGGGGADVGDQGQPYRTGGSGGDGLCTDISGQMVCYGGGGQGNNAQVYGNSLPIGCWWARQLPITATSFDSANAHPAIDLGANPPQFFVHLATGAHFDDGNGTGGVPSWCPGANGAGPSATGTPTPTPTPANGTIQARAVQVFPSDISCNAVNNPTAPALPGTTTFSTNPSLGDLPQSGSTYVSWSAPPGPYSISAVAPTNYVLAAACWNRTLTNPTSDTGLSSSIDSGETLTWNLGFTLGTPWSEVTGGDVYASSQLNSPIPDSHVFINDGTGGYPGVATYGLSYHFDSGAVTGRDKVSSTNWLAHESTSTVDYYQLMLSRFGGAPAAWDYTSPDPANPDSYLTHDQPGYKADMDTPYYVNGSLETTGNWLIPDGKKLIFIVNGNLKIDGFIKTSGSGFIAFIVKGNIIVSPDVGTTFDSSSSVLDGVYITSPTGTFETGHSTSVGHERFVGFGTFVAGSFLLTRDLSSVSHNQDTSAELFIYNPANLIYMPEAMKESAVSWQEVAP